MKSLVVLLVVGVGVVILNIGVLYAETLLARWVVSYFWIGAYNVPLKVWFVGILLINSLFSGGSYVKK